MDELIFVLKSEPSSFHFPIIITAPLLIFHVILHKIECALESIFREFTNISCKSDSVFVSFLPQSSLLTHNYIFFPCTKSTCVPLNSCAAAWCFIVVTGLFPGIHSIICAMIGFSSVYQRERRLWALPSVIRPRFSLHHLHIFLLQSTSSNLPLQTAVLLLLLPRSLQSPSLSPFVFLLYEHHSFQGWLNFSWESLWPRYQFLYPLGIKK